MECYCFHNSRQLLYREPFGAVQRGTAVRVSLFAKWAREVALLVECGDKVLRKSPNVRRFSDGLMYDFTILAEQTGIVRYCFLVETDDGTMYYCGSGGEGHLTRKCGDRYQLTVYERLAPLPEWFKSACVYQIFPDRFYKSDKKSGEKYASFHRAKGRRVRIHEDFNEQVEYMPTDGSAYYEPTDYFCGDLWGVIEKLPYIKSLGVNCIYLNPIFEAASNHRYNTGDYMNVDPMLGGNEAFSALLRECERFSVRVILDGVFSHTGSDSVYFNKNSSYPGVGAYQSKDSEYFSWYDFSDFPDKYRSWWGFTTLPELSESDKSYQRFVLSVLDRWRSEGVSGWRLDVADELPDEFIELLYKSEKAANPDSILLGEVWEDATNKVSMGDRRRYVDGGELDSVMNYPFRAMLFDFLLYKSDAYALENSMYALLENYPRDFYYALLNLLGSHDTVRAQTALSCAPGRDELTREQQAKFRPSERHARLGRARMRLAVTMQFAIPGVPCIYYGDEAGALGMADPFNRGTFPWGGEDTALTAFYRELSALRGSDRMFIDGDVLYAALNADVFSVVRILGKRNAIVLINRSEEGKRVVIKNTTYAFGAAAGKFALCGRYKDALSGNEYAGEQLELYLPGLGAMALIGS